MTDKEKQKVTLSLKHGTLDILRQKAKEVGMLIERGSEAGNGNVSEYLNSLAWAEKNRSAAPSEYPLQHLIFGFPVIDPNSVKDVEFRAKLAATERQDGPFPVQDDLDEVNAFDAWFTDRYGLRPGELREEISDITERLYITEDNRYIVHVTLSSPVWDSTEAFILEVAYEDLRPGGRFRDLGTQTGIEPATTLDEALALQKRTRQEWEKTHPLVEIEFEILESGKELIADQPEGQE